MDALAQIARTVLYEGYVLWPYTRSATKNQQRWTFGGVYPGTFAAESSGVDRAVVRTENLIEASSGTRVDVSVRFLHVVERQVMRLDDGVMTPVGELRLGETRYLSWDEAVEREVATTIELRAGAASALSHVVPISIDPGETTERLGDGATGPGGAIVRSWKHLGGTLAVEVATVESLAPRTVFRLTATITNSSDWHGTERSEAVRHTFCSAHVVLQATDGAFVSAVDPDAVFAADAGRCRNEGLWPVLVGDDGARDTMLAAPIILGDYPRVAPESPGDLFDGGEIDQLLILNVMALTDEEQQEMRDSDPRTREILDRCASLSEDQLSRLHGAVRSLASLTVTENVDERHLV